MFFLGNMGIATIAVPIFYIENYSLQLFLHIRPENRSKIVQSGAQIDLLKMSRYYLYIDWKR